MSAQKVGDYFWPLPSSRQALPYSTGYHLRLIVSSGEEFPPVEGNWDYIVKLMEIVGKKKFFSQHPAQVFPYWGVSVIFEQMDRLAPVVGIVEKGVYPLHAASAPEDLLRRVVLYIPEMGKRHVCKALQTKMLFMVIQRNTTNSTYLWEQ